MTTLVNRECWHIASGHLEHGQITSQRFNPDMCVLRLDSGTERPIASVNAILALSQAIDECSKQAEYWIRQERLLCIRYDEQTKEASYPTL